LKKILYIFLFFALTGNCFGQNKSDEIFTIVEQMPEFPGGNTEMFGFIQKNIVYPKAEQKKNITGKAFVKFIVEKDGSVSNPEIIKSSGNKKLDKEAVRVVSIMPKWSPGKQNGNLARVYFNLPIVFKL
jgi:protein TonB